MSVYSQMFRGSRKLLFLHSFYIAIHAHENASHGRKVKSLPPGNIESVEGLLPDGPSLFKRSPSKPFLPYLNYTIVVVLVFHNQYPFPCQDISHAVSRGKMWLTSLPYAYYYANQFINRT